MSVLPKKYIHIFSFYNKEGFDLFDVSFSFTTMSYIFHPTTGDFDNLTYSIYSLSHTDSFYNSHDISVIYTFTGKQAVFSYGSYTQSLSIEIKFTNSLYPTYNKKFNVTYYRYLYSASDNLPVTEALHGWYKPGNYDLLLGEVLCQVLRWYDSSPNSNNLIANVRRRSTPDNKSKFRPEDTEATRSFIYTLSDGGLLLFQYSTNFIGRQLALYPYPLDVRYNSSKYSRRQSPETTLGTRTISYAKGYSIFYVYKNHFTDLNANMTFSYLIAQSNSYYPNIDLNLVGLYYNNIPSRLTTDNISISGIPLMPVHSPVCINRFGYSSSFNARFFDDYPLNEAGWFIMFNVPPFSVDPFESGSLYTNSYFFPHPYRGNGVVYDTHSGYYFSYSSLQYMHELLYTYSFAISFLIPAITIVKFFGDDYYTSQRCVPFVFPYITFTEYNSLSIIEKQRLHNRFIYNKDCINVVGFVIREDYKLSGSTYVSVSYTWSIYFNETQSRVHSVSYALPPSLSYYEFIDGTSNNPDYPKLYGGFAVGSGFGMAGDYLYEPIDYIFRPHVFSLSLYEVIFYTTAHFNSAPLIMDYLMKKYGVPYTHF